MFLTATHRVGVFPNTVAGSKDTVVSGEVDSGPGHQGNQMGDEAQRVKDHMGGAIAIRCLQFVAHIAVGDQ